MKKQFIEAGRIVNTHGIRGEVKIQPWVDSAGFLADFNALYLDGETPLPLLDSFVHKGCLIAKLEGIESVEAAMALKNRVVYIARDDASLPEGAFFIQDILGAKVVSENGELLGVLQDVMELPHGRIYVVKGEREILVPAVSEFIKDTDVESGVITVRLIEGM